MENADTEFLKWEMEDQGISDDFQALADKSFEDKNFYEMEEDDEVFVIRENSQIQTHMLSNLELERKRNQQAQPISPPRTVRCCAEWSLSHRCMHCAWRTQRGNRPKHPAPKVLSPAPATPPLVTLQSLGTTRDSGYEPSPTSAFSFSFTSDDEDTEVEDSDPCNTLGVDDPLAATGTTPPINIPFGRTGVDARRKSRSSKPSNDRSGEDKSSPTDREEVGMPPTVVTPASPDTTPVSTPLRRRQRSKSVPELYASERMLSRTPIVFRNGTLVRECHPQAQAPVHGRNYSLPATDAQGRPVFAPPPPTPAPRSSREGLIDLTEEDPEGSSGHHRRVLVLNLPDLLVDVTSLSREDSPVSSSSTCSLQSPSGKGSCYSTSSKDTNPSFSPSRNHHVSSLRVSRSLSGASTDSGEGKAVKAQAPSRPTWRRPRALSCDVTLEVEFGQELRKIADNFTKSYSKSDGGVWSSLRNKLGRRVSLGTCTPLNEVSCMEDASAERVSHSLPTTPHRPPTVERGPTQYF